MTIRNPSVIPYSAIDETYPVAGVDNNSQGFRDNFSYIKSGLSTAASEITLLNNKAVLLDEDNTFDDVLLEDARTKNVYPVINVRSVSTALADIDVLDGSCQIITITANTKLKLNTWPTGNRYASLRMMFINGTSTTKTLEFELKQSVLGRIAFKKDGFPNNNTITLDPPIISNGITTTKRYIFDAWSHDAGATFYIEYLGVFSHQTEPSV